MMRELWVTVRETTTRTRCVEVPDEFDATDEQAVLAVYRDSGPGEELEDETFEEVADVHIEPSAAELTARRVQHRGATA